MPERFDVKASLMSSERIGASKAMPTDAGKEVDEIRIRRGTRGFILSYGDHCLGMMAPHEEGISYRCDVARRVTALLADPEDVPF